MEASTLSRASRRGLLARRSPLLRLERDERLVALIRAGHETAFDTLFNRYHARLLAFCSSMLKSRQDAEDVLQEVFANAHRAMLADQRAIKVRPWLYRIARNRCLNQLRKPVPEGQDSMDHHVYENGTTTAQRVQDREELRSVISDVQTLPETQRAALLLREIDQLSYEEIAQAMETTIPAVKSLLVRARISLAESSQARQLTCEEVRVGLAEAAEGIAKASGPLRQHVRGCEPCGEFRDQLRSDRRALASLLPVGPFALLSNGLLGKLLGAGSGSAASGCATGSGAAGGAIGGALAGGAACGATASGLSAVGSKAAAGVAAAALLTAGAVEVSRSPSGPATPPPSNERAVVPPPVAEEPVAERARRARTEPHRAPTEDGPDRESQAASEEPRADEPATPEEPKETEADPGKAGDGTAARGSKQTDGSGAKGSVEDDTAPSGGVEPTGTPTDGQRAGPGEEPDAGDDRRRPRVRDLLLALLP